MYSIFFNNNNNNKMYVQTSKHVISQVKNVVVYTIYGSLEIFKRKY